MRYEPIHGFRAGASEPTGGVMQASTGELYGVTEEGGANDIGSVYRMSPDGSSLVTLVHFTGTAGSAPGRAPNGVVTEWVDGDLNQFFYGVTREGGAQDMGTVYRMEPGGGVETLIEFSGTSGAAPGSYPEGSLLLASDGNFYGTTSEGGANDEGTVFRMTPDGVLTTLFSFDHTNGANPGAYPRAGLAEGPLAGAYFGTTSVGGASDEGTIFKITDAGVVTTLVEFTGETGAAIGSFPIVRMTLGSDDVFYGVTQFGGRVDDFWNNQGVIFKMTPAGAYTPLVGFVYPIPNENRGMWPKGPLVEGSPGVFYGTTYRGGWYDRGSVFKVTSGGDITTLVDFDLFTAPKGAGPMGQLVKVATDTVIGTTSGGGSATENHGTAYRISNTGALTTLVEFNGRGSQNEGGPALPKSALLEGSDGNFYGTTYEGGTFNKGTIYRLTPVGVRTTLVNFTGDGAENKGANPMAELLQAGDGNFYGTTESGGANDLGTIYRMTPAGTLTTLVNFSGAAGAQPGSFPRAGLVDGGDGFFYGTTHSGGAADAGTVFKVTTAGTLTTLAEFTWNGAVNKGGEPSGTMVKATDGNFYGTTEHGGADSSGTIFKITAAGVLTTIHESSPFSAQPVGITQGSDGIFYGTCRGSGFPLPFGGYSAYGNVFSITAAGDYSVLVNFYGEEEFGTKGRHPLSGLVEGPDGNLYGTTSAGGSDDRGTLFRVEKSGFLTTLGEFSGTAGDFPGEAPEASPMIVGSDGELYGTTAYGGVDDAGKAAGLGQVFRLRFWDHRNNKPIEQPLTEAGLPPATGIAWTDEAAGMYDGLLRDSADGTTLIGALNRLIVSTAKAGSGQGGPVSATIRMNGRSASLRGVFDAGGRLLLALAQKDGSVVNVDLQLMRSDSAATETLRGTIEWDGVIAVVDLDRVIYHARRNPAPPGLVSRYTMVLPSQAGWGETEPGGDGWALLTLNTSGAVSVKGVLGDGSKFSEGAYLSGENECSLYRELYRSQPEKGRFGGKLKFRDVAGISDFDGVMQWTKFADDRETRYPDGFAVEVWAVGSRYVAPPRGQRVLTQLADQEYNARVSLIDESLLDDDGQIDRAVSWAANNRIKHYGPEKLSATVKSSSGSLSGSYYHPDTRQKIAFTGVAFQKQGIAGGVALLPTNSGAVRIQPGTGLVYPGSEDAGVMTYLQSPDSPASAPATSNQLWDPAVAGTYHGNLDEGGLINGAIQSLVISTRAGFSGSIWIDGKRYAVKGTFAPDGVASTQILRKGLTPIDVELQLVAADGLADAFQVKGSVDIDGRTLDIDGQRRPAYTKIDRAPWEGRYTMVMPAAEGIDDNAEPGGDGYGTLTVSYTGVCKGSLVLADGGKTSLSGHVSRSGEWALYRGLYGRTPKGYLSGKLVFRDQPAVSDVDGQVHWVKDPLASKTVYAGGFDIVRSIVGSVYTAPAIGVIAWNELNYDYHNAWLRLAGTDFSTLATLDISMLDRAVTWSTANTIRYYGPESITFRFSTKTGTLTGRVADKTNGIDQKFGGVLFQKQGLVSGSYLSQGKSGAFWMEPR